MHIVMMIRIHVYQTLVIVDQTQGALGKPINVQRGSANVVRTMNAQKMNTVTMGNAEVPDI